MASQHCLASFWRQKNIKISSDLGKMVKKNQSPFYNESGSAFYNESGSESRSGSSPRFITYQAWGLNRQSVGLFASPIKRTIIGWYQHSTYVERFPTAYGVGSFKAAQFAEGWDAKRIISSSSFHLNRLIVRDTPLLVLRLAAEGNPLMTSRTSHYAWFRLNGGKFLVITFP